MNVRKRPQSQQVAIIGEVFNDPPGETLLRFYYMPQISDPFVLIHHKTDTVLNQSSLPYISSHGSPSTDISKEI